MASYLVTKFKGKYRVMPDLTLDTHDFSRNMDGSIDEDAVYIKCYYDCKIMYYGNGILMAYIPSIGRGHNIQKAMKKDDIEIVDYDESSEEVLIKFKVKDVDYMANLMKAVKWGADIGPFSSKNIPKNKDIKIPEEDMKKYKKIVEKIDKSDALKIKSWNSAFLNDVLQKKIRKDTKNKKYDVKEDMKQSQLSRQTKEFIFSKGAWEDYLKYLDNIIDEYYNNN